MKTLLVTSASTGEGKTTTAANLALTFARQGTRVLLVDCDLRRPRLHRIFNAEREPGLVDLLLGRADAAEVVQPTSVDRLSLVARGQFEESAIEALGGAGMQNFLQASSEHFDLVILDTAPVLVAADTPNVAAHADAVLLVVRAGKTQRNEGRQALRQLSAVGANVIGAVLNDPDSTADRYGEYYYKEYYPAEV
jgi:capsular exopolysaccharide synthesis family protein